MPTGDFTWATPPERRKSNSTIATGEPSTCPTTGASKASSIEKNPDGQGRWLSCRPASAGIASDSRCPTSRLQPRVVVEFDGVMANSEVWINGHRVGERPYGYVSFQYDLTDHLHFGETEPNVLAVRVDNSKQPASRWYTGARHLPPRAADR